MKQLMPISPGGAGLRFIQLPGLPEVVTAQQVAQFFDVPTKRIWGAIKRNPRLFEQWARRATDEETENLKTQNASFKSVTRRANPILITFEGLLLLAASMKNPTAVSVMLAWAESTGRIRRQQSLLIQEQIEGGAPIEQIAQTVAPKKPRKKQIPNQANERIEGAHSRVTELGLNRTDAGTAMLMYAAANIDDLVATMKQAIDINNEDPDSGTKH